MKKGLIIGIGLVAFLGIAVFLSMQDEKVDKLSVKEEVTQLDQVGESFPDQGRTHIDIGQSHEPYNSNPPTSGPHYVNPANWGIYSIPLKDEQAVHNLEHGGIWITYKDIDDETKALLEKIARANPGSVIMSPRLENDSKIALASWTRLEKLDSYDETKILEFIKANKNKAPEPLAD
jgi:hypothetical protein